MTPALALPVAEINLDILMPYLGFVTPQIKPCTCRFPAALALTPSGLWQVVCLRGHAGQTAKLPSSAIAYWNARSKS